MTNITLPDARLSNLTLSPKSDQCLFIKDDSGNYKPVLIKDGGTWKINPAFVST